MLVPSCGRGADPAPEDDLHLLRAADVEVVGAQRLEEPPGMRRCGEHDGPRDLDLAHRDVPPIPAGPSVSQSRCTPAGSSVVANPLSNSVNPIPAAVAARLAYSCPFSRSSPGTGSTHRPSRTQAEHLIDEMEVVRGDAAVGLVVAEPRDPATVGVAMVVPVNTR